MSHVIHRSLHSTPMVASRAQGAYIFDAQGKPYLDACGGAAVSCLGHAHPDVLAAMHRQIDRLAYAHTSFFTSDAVEQLAEHLTRTAPGELNYAYFVSGGSEAVETALKMARQYFVEIGQPSRTRFIARQQSYHGNTLGALAVGGNEWRRRQFAPLLMDVIRVSACNEYRDRRTDETQQQYTERLLNELEQAILEAGPETIIGFCAETVVGATTGATPPTPGYLQGVRRLCDKYGILYIADEVMCGMGRTGTLHAFEQDDVVPDLVTIAKGLGGGYQPIGAVLASETIVSALKAGSGLFQHGHTYICHATAASAALAVQQVIARDNLLDAVKQQGAYLHKALREVLGELPHVGDTRGRGLFAGVELVRDKDDKTPFDPALKLHAAIKANCMARGLMVYPMGGTIDGQSGDHILIAPPFIITPAQLDFVVDTLNSVIREETGKL
ncbi:MULTISPECIES: aspartate aminotransferase family protein [Klebsiella]|jgi:adenosylmethionine-8-amino-7-oxononanoate aminotransferase|uniref:aspartate aminotransferase family protein n=1 Tax=Klebsiella TaxID=570 RepID=UPI000A2EB8B3|nr:MULTISPECIES: aspartate aminotransferase family protein [Klebsiella]MVY10989.1 aspartate aminotransferase family protein [Enterobacteriaceae bacterium 8376wH8]MCQ3902457.1 aspartate aminotransferase family protein [Klebsiella quasipneumoniae]MDD9615372.1 aspartate aminotransferase family protein [Klebsiella quasipneumoniae]MDD9620109.1 aspartate aminotransferase family protein [Klebsiella quasipneumoniae]MDD9626138.1 aspartate aminotransferase family protein [Klebsiella quasipneumoniae]